ncbi:MAG: ABC transporter permease [Clostridia bacterium]|nr:ABC transporter permease [Clostridia bacterium]
MTKKIHFPRLPLFHLVKRERMNIVSAMLIRVIAFLLGMLTCGLLASVLIDELHFDRQGLEAFYKCFIDGSFTTNRKLIAFIKDLAVLLCIALALAPAFKMRFWNTGAEGQTLVGVLAAIMVNFHLGGSYDKSIALPDWQLALIMLAAAMLAGAIWALIPALFKAKWNTNETLFTLMMNYVASFLTSFCIVRFLTNSKNSSGSMKSLASGRLVQLFTDVKMPSIDKPGESFTISQNLSDSLTVGVIVLAVTLILFIYLRYSKHGYEISVVGESTRTASYVGINVKKVIIRTMLVSGMLCGLAGWLIAQVDRSVNTESSVNGQGVTAILVAWLARFNPIFMIVTAGIVVFLNKGASRIATDYHVASSLPNVFVGIVLFFIIGSEFFVNYKLKLSRRGSEEAIK